MITLTSEQEPKLFCGWEKYVSSISDEEIYNLRQKLVEQVRIEEQWGRYQEGDYIKAIYNINSCSKSTLLKLSCRNPENTYFFYLDESRFELEYEY